MGEFEDKLQSILGDPEAMGQIMSIAQALTGDGGQDAAPAPQSSAPELPFGDGGGVSPFSLLGDLDPRMIQMGMQLLSEYNSNDDQKTALLAALRPFVKKERYAKVDKAIQIARLSRIARVALNAFKKGDDGHV